jgi:hypothetical protein
VERVIKSAIVPLPASEGVRVKFLDFEFTPEQKSFRHKVRAWLGANLPKDLCVDDAQDERIASNREVFERRRAWQAKLHRAGYAGSRTCPAQLFRARTVRSYSYELGTEAQKDRSPMHRPGDLLAIPVRD